MSPGPVGSAALEARGLEKWFGAQPALRGLDFTVSPGEFVTVFGPNGAGKTTLLRILMGATRPTRGEVRVAGADPLEDDTRRGIGLLSHQSFLYPGLTAAENLDFYARLHGLRDRGERVREALRGVEMDDRADHRLRTFSRGMQQRVALARTLLHDPAVVLLDEPYTGLDPHAAAVLRATLERLRDGRRTVLLVTHNLSQGLELADRVVVQVGGRWISDEPRSAIDPSGWEREYTARVAAAG